MLQTRGGSKCTHLPIMRSKQPHAPARNEASQHSDHQCVVMLEVTMQGPDRLITQHVAAIPLLLRRNGAQNLQGPRPPFHLLRDPVHVVC